MGPNGAYLPGQLAPLPRYVENMRGYCRDDQVSQQLRLTFGLRSVLEVYLILGSFTVIPYYFYLQLMILPFLEKRSDVIYLRFTHFYITKTSNLTSAFLTRYSSCGEELANISKTFIK